MLTVYALVIGFILDALWGDPLRLPHPVVWMGRAIGAGETRLRRVFSQDGRSQRRAGLILAIILPLASFCISAGLLLVLFLIHPLAAFVAECWMCYQILSARELWRQSMKVYRALRDQGIAAGREAVSRIVGRDTAELDEGGVIKATVETVAENTADGVVAPLFYMVIGGAPLGMAYKAINTMDSMIGYKNEKYLDFGCAAARLDDIANFLPSRLTAFFMIAVSPLIGLSGKGAWRMWRRDRHNHASPNSAQTEAACAGALGVQLAGDAVYFGKTFEKPAIGDATRLIALDDIARANRLMYASSIVALVLFCSARAVLIGIG